MINARTWNHLCSTGLIIFPGLIVSSFALKGAAWEWLSAVMILWGGALALYGAYCGIQMVRGKLKLGCPTCNTTSQVLGGNRDGLYLDCPCCGELRIKNGLFRLKVYKTADEITEQDEDTPEKRYAALIAPKNNPRFFAVLFLPVIASIIASSLIYKFLWFYMLIPGFWCYGVGGMLVDGISRGRLSDNHGTAFRKKNPVRFWGKVSIWFLAYIFAASFPIGYAIQEHNREQTKKPAIPPSEREYKSNHPGH